MYNRISPYVINKHNTSEECCDVSVSVEGWKENFEDTVVSVDVTVDNADSAYIDGVGYADGNIKFKLTPEAADLTENKKILLHVDFGESFHNYKVAFDIPVVITGKFPVECAIDWDTANDFEYDGKAKELLYNIWSDYYEDFKEMIEYYQGDVKLDSKPTAAGTYTVEVTYTDEDNLTEPAFGEVSFTIAGSGSGSGSGSTTPSTQGIPSVL